MNAWEILRDHQTQIDEDGVMCGVSREAVHVALAEHTALIVQMDEMADAIRRVILAFETHGNEVGFIASHRTRRECEASMVALKAALTATEPA